MKSLCIVLVVVCLNPGAAAGEQRLRPVDPWAEEAFARASERSALMRDLVGRLEASNLIVHIETRTVMPSGVGGTTRFVTSAGPHRYVRIAVARDLEPDERAAILGHELQHACEIAASSAYDHQAVRQLFEGTGHHVGGRGGRAAMFETRAAVLAGERIWVELRYRPTYAQGTSAFARAPADKSAGKQER